MIMLCFILFFFFSSRRRHTRSDRDWSSDVCSSDLSFVQRDSTAARAIIPRDKEVDALNREMHAALTQHMIENPSAIGRCLHWIVAAKSLERIADQAKNIADDVVYLCDAQDIRHRAA